MGTSALPGFEALPGADLVREGLKDLGEGTETPAALLVSMAAPRLRFAGIEVPPADGRTAGHRLYALLAADDPASAHSRYNALLGRMASFARAAEHARAG